MSESIDNSEKRMSVVPFAVTCLVIIIGVAIFAVVRSNREWNHLADLDRQEKLSLAHAADVAVQTGQIKFDDLRAIRERIGDPEFMTILLGGGLLTNEDVARLMNPNLMVPLH